MIRASGFLAAWLMPLIAAAQEAAAPLGTGGDAIALPGVGRIVLVFCAMAALAVAASFVLRKALARFGSPLVPGSSSAIRVLERASLSATLKVHLVQVGDHRLLVAEGRQGLTVVDLGSAPPVPTP